MISDLDSEVILTKKCKWCGENKPLLDFHSSKNLSFGRSMYCKPCTADYARKKRRAINPLLDRPCEVCEKVFTPKRHRLERFCNSTCAQRGKNLNQYGLSWRDYHKILDKQGGKCAICRRPQSKQWGGYMLAVDHCHNTKVVRGLLCNSCNLALGYFKNDPKIIAAALKYAEANHLFVKTS